MDLIYQEYIDLKEIADVFSQQIIVYLWSTYNYVARFYYILKDISDSSGIFFVLVAKIYYLQF